MKDGFPLVSIVIPVFNSESFLDLCIQSAINQSYKCIEIIVVNDGSTDDSEKIIFEYEFQDSRINYIKKEKNEGLVKARKTGIEAAHGKYIQYLDSDDVLCLDAIELLVGRAEKMGADIVVAPFNFLEGENRVSSNHFSFDVLSGLEFLAQILMSKAYWSVWSKFHLRSLYSHEIERPEISLGEDVILSTQLLLYSTRIATIDAPIIDYRICGNSISHRMDEDSYKDFNLYLLWFEDYIRRCGLNKVLSEPLAFFHFKNALMRLYWKKKSDAHREMKSVIRDIACYPDLKNVLSRRERKIIAAYRYASWLGYLNLLRYYKQGKI